MFWLDNVNAQVNYDNSMTREIIFYTTNAGKSPVEEFLDELSPKEAQKAAWVIRLVEIWLLCPGSIFKKRSIRMVFGKYV